MRGVARVVMVCAWLMGIPAAASAQFAATIAGVVRDASGAVVPGVTVEATSPALIEKVRSAVTDGSGQFRIVTLPPGTYSVTFTLPGFNTVRRDGIELSGTFTATVNAELRVGALEETVTVTGETPLVDVQSATQQRVIDAETVALIPQSRLPSSMVALIPGITVANGAGNWYGSGGHDVGGAQGDVAGVYSIHGGATQDSRLMVNGVSTGWGNESFESGYSVNMSAVQEVVVDTAASVEAESGGVRTNIVPRDGGNVFSGTVFGAYSNQHLQWGNLNQTVKDRGLLFTNSVKVNGDFNPGFGGPIKRNRVWFYTSARYLRSDQYAAGVYADSTQDDPNVWKYTPDTTRKAYNNGTWKDAQMRVTWQATRIHKFAASYSQQTSCKCPSLISSTQSGGTDNRWGHPQHIETVDWTAPLTNRFLMEFSGLHQLNRWGFFPRRTAPLGLVGFLEQSNGMNMKTRSGGYRDAVNETLRYRVTVNYVTGANALRVGYVNAWARSDYNTFDLYPLRYRLNNGVPNQITMRVIPFHDGLFVLDGEPGLFAQNRTTIKRLTLTLGARYDGKLSHFPEQMVGDPTNPYGVSPFLPRGPFVVPRTDQLRWHDITPRMSAAYDLTGNGKTAVKASLNKYLDGTQVDSYANPVANLVLSTTRSWTDRNGDFKPDCVLLDPATNGECGAMANPNFGTSVGGTIYDPRTIRGWGVRPYNWEFSTGVQREILPRVSADLSYFRRWYGNLWVTAERNLTAADYDRFSVIAPSDPRLPNGGGYAVTGLNNLKPGSFGKPEDPLVTFSKPYGKSYRHWNGVDATINARLRQGLTLQGGISTGRTSTDNCELRERFPTLAPSTSMEYCHIDTTFLTQVKFLGAYTIPRVDLHVSASLQSIPGPEIAANVVYTSAQLAQSLGRPLSGGAANVTVNVVKPGSMYGDRLNQLDLRFSKSLRYAGMRTLLNFDLYNALNGSAVRQQSNTFGNWQQPSAILIGRSAKFSVQYDF